MNKIIEDGIIKFVLKNIIYHFEISRRLVSYNEREF